MIIVQNIYIKKETTNINKALYESKK